MSRSPDPPGSDESAADGRLTHLDQDGAPQMVDVSDKAVTRRRAVAEGAIRMTRATMEALRDGTGPKGDALLVARVAGITGGKRAGELIPLCHLLPEAALDVQVEVDEELPGVRMRAIAKITGRTGVEMEALTAVSVGLLTVYDMAKALDRTMTIEGVRLVQKEGGRSGAWTASASSEE